MTFPSQGGHIPTMEKWSDLPCPWHLHPKSQFWAAKFDHQETTLGCWRHQGHSAGAVAPGIAPWLHGHNVQAAPLSQAERDRELGAA